MILIEKTLSPVRKNTDFSDQEKKWEKYSNAMQSAANSSQFVDTFNFFELYNCYPDDTGGYDCFFFGAFFLLGSLQSIQTNPLL